MEVEKRFHVTLVRHGETMENREGIIQGQADTLLSELGRRQAAMVGSRLRNEKFTHMFSSDLSRAHHTAKAIVDANQASTCELVLDKRLRERSFGVLQGQSFEDFRAMIKEKDLNLKSFTPEGGESIEEVTKRAADFFKAICKIAEPNGPPIKGSCAIVKSSDSALEVGSSTNSIQAGNSAAVQEDVSEGVADDSVNEKKNNKALNDLDSENNCSSPHLTLNIETQSSCFEDVVDNNLDYEAKILIVSHGLLLKELHRMIINRYKGVLTGEFADLVNRVSPNTGVSQFVMSSKKQANGKVCIECKEICVLHSKSHLVTANEDLVTEAKF